MELIRFGYELRHRRQGYTSVPLAECSEPRRQVRLGRLPALTFGTCFGAFLGIGVICTVWAPQPPDTGGGGTIPDDAYCTRIERAPDHVKVQLALGTPPRIVTALFRPDRVVERGAAALRIFSTRSVESSTLKCDGLQYNCSDALLLTRGTAGTASAVVVNFTYVNYEYEEAIGGLAADVLRLQAEFNVMRGARYWVTASHLCFDPVGGDLYADTDGALAATYTADGGLVTQASALVRVDADLVRDSAPHAAHRAGTCAGTSGELTNVDVFPLHGAYEAAYLALQDHLLYESEPTAVGSRRSVAELGYLCAGAVPWMQHAYHLYLLDCRALNSCRSGPSLPWRRVTTNSLRMYYRSDGTVHIWMKHAPALDAMPGLHEPVDAITIGVVRLALISLVAATIWIRSNRYSSAPQWLYRHCVAIANCVDAPKTAQQIAANALPISEDAALGLTCMLARGAVLLWRRDLLLADDQGRVVVLEYIACVLSILHWIARYWILEPNLLQMIAGGRHHEGPGPLTRLGGSSAIIDGSMAVLLVYTRTPLLVSDGGFDATARLLTGVLLALVCLQRAVYGACCCAVLLESSWEQMLQATDAYRNLLIGGMLFWLWHVLAIGVALADVVSSPMAMGLMRAQVGDRTPLNVCVYATLAALGIPRMLKHSVQMLHWRDKTEDPPDGE